MKDKYRIRQVEKIYASGRTEIVYIIEKRWLCFWFAITGYEPMGDWSYREEFDSYKKAEEFLDKELDTMKLKEYIK